MDDPKDVLLRKCREWVADLSRPLPYVTTKLQLELIDEIDAALSKPDDPVMKKPLSSSQH
jgi:hypothetical protein